MKNFLLASSILCLGTLAQAAPKVVSTTNFVNDLVSIVAGDKVSASGLMGEGIDPHLYRATAKDLVKLREAELIFYNGLGLEGKIAEVLEKMAKQKRVIAVSDAVPKEKVLRSEGAPDPHIWFDPELWLLAASSVRNELSQLLPADEALFNERFDDFQKKVRELAKLSKERIQRIPKKQRVLVTSHDAFQYFGQYFGLELLPVQGLSTESEAGLKRIRELVAKVKQEQIPAVFVESSVPKDTIERVQETSGAKIGGELYSDALGASSSPAGSYLGMLEHNVSVIVESLAQ